MRCCSRCRAVCSARKDAGDAVPARMHRKRRIVQRGSVHLNAAPSRNPERLAMSRVKTPVPNLGHHAQHQNHIFVRNVEFAAFVIFQAVQGSIVGADAADLNRQSAESAVAQVVEAGAALQYRVGRFVHNAIPHRLSRQRCKQFGKIVAAQYSAIRRKFRIFYGK